MNGYRMKGKLEVDRGRLLWELMASCSRVCQRYLVGWNEAVDAIARKLKNKLQEVFWELVVVQLQEKQ